jgi:PTS system nitrogen regulatory IIA component
MELTIKEVAFRLNIPIETLHRWVRQGKIPMQRSRGEYTIREEMFNRWADEHKLNIQPRSDNTQQGSEAAFDGVLPAMQRGGIYYDLKGDSKEAALQSVVAKIPNLEGIDRKIVFEKLLEREQLASTGIGHGVALPHPRANPGVGLMVPQITTCFFPEPVPFDAIDHRPVSVMMVLLSGSTRLHLHLLSKISFFLRNVGFRDYLLTAPPAKDLLDKVAEMD